MKRLLTTAVAAAVAVAATGSAAEAQEFDRKVPLFEFGLYAGGAYTSDWLDVNERFGGFGFTEDEDFGDDGFGFGFTPAFGLTATYYFSPMFGVRYHTAYLPSDVPTRSDDEGNFGDLQDAFNDINAFEDDESDYPLNNWFYDLSVVFRPWVMDQPGFLSTAYFFLGGGGLTTNVAGEGDGPLPGVGFAEGDEEVDCVNEFVRLGACLSYQPSFATVGQGTLGVGFDFLPINDMFGVFAELGFHIYDSPIHTFGDEDDEGFDVASPTEDTYAVTTRLVAGVKLALGDITPAPVVVVPPAPPVTPPPPPPAERPIQVCVVQGPAVVNVDAVFLPETGDTVVVVDGVRRPFAQVYPAVPPAYAAGAPFFVNREAVMFQDRRYVQFGLPRVITPAEVTRVGEFQGVGLYAATGAETPPEVLYVPVRPGCEFQPYQREAEVRKVRG